MAFSTRIVLRLVERVRDLLFHLDALVWAIRQHHDARGEAVSEVDQALYDFVPTSLYTVNENLIEQIGQREGYLASLDADIKSMLAYQAVLQDNIVRLEGLLQHN